jgi:hypothetical protein
VLKTYTPPSIVESSHEVLPLLSAAPKSLTGGVAHPRSISALIQKVDCGLIDNWSKSAGVKRNRPRGPSQSINRIGHRDLLTSSLFAR